MGTTSIYRTQATDTVTVSTVRIRSGRATWYETALIVNGRVTDGRRTASKNDAGFEHDAAVAFLRGYEGKGTLRGDFYADELAAVSK